MREYLLSIVGIVFISGILNAILPEGKTSGMVKSTAKLCCLLVILTPVAEFVSKGGEKDKIFSDFLDESVIQTDQAFINYSSGKRIDEAETLLKEEIESEYHVSIQVELLWEYQQENAKGYTANAIKIKAIVLTFLTQTSEEIRLKIAEKLQEKYQVEVRFIEI